MVVLVPLVALAMTRSSPALAVPDRAERLTFEALGGAVGFAGSMAMALGATKNQSGGGGRAIGIGGALAPGALLVLTPLFVTPLGVYLAGKASGAHGSYWGSMGGLCLGALVGLLPSAALLGNKYRILGLLTLMTFGVAGAVGGYELWNDTKSSPANPSPSAAPNAGLGGAPFSVVWLF